MKKIQLTQNKYALVDDEDYNYLSQFKWLVRKSNNIFYASRYDYEKQIFVHMHRLIMNCPDNKFIDHINKSGLDNRKENLRVCNKSQNMGNSKVRKDNTSGIRGVAYDKKTKKWQSQIHINGKTKFLGRFVDKLEAKKAYEKEAKQHFGEFYLCV